MSDMMIGWLLFIGFIAFGAWIVRHNLRLRKKLQSDPKLMEEYLRAQQLAPRRFGPSVNVDGTPLMPGGCVDVLGKPYGRGHDWSRR